MIKRSECRCSCHNTFDGASFAMHIAPCCEPDMILECIADDPAQHIIDRYSTPGLKRNELSRDAKKAQLQESFKNDTREEREAILDKLYGPVHTKTQNDAGML